MTGNAQRSPLGPALRVAWLLSCGVALSASEARAVDVAVLKSIETPAWRPTIDALRRTAAGHNVVEYDLRGERNEGVRIAAELKAKPGTVVVSMGLLAAQTVREAAPELPQIYCMIQDPAQAGLAGAPNVWGVAFATPVRNQMAAFRMVNPRAVRIAVLYSADNVGRLVDEAVQASGLMRLIVMPKKIASEREVPDALRGLLKGSEGADALWLPPDPVLLGDETRRFLLNETLKAGKPVYTFSPTLVSEGALVSNGPDYSSIGEQVAELVERLASGDRARSEMLVPRAELVINKKIADRLKVEIPATALAAASKVF